MINDRNFITICKKIHKGDILMVVGGNLIIVSIRFILLNGIFIFFNGLENLNSVLAFAAATLVFELIFLFIGSSKDSFKEISLGVKEVSEGNLSKRFLYKDNRFKEISESLNRIVEKYRMALAQIDYNSQNIMSVTKKLSAISNETTKSVDEIARAIEDIAYGASEQANISKNILGKSGKLKDISINTSQHTLSAKEKCLATNNHFKESKNTLQSLIGGMLSRTEKNEELSNKTKEISNKVDEINNIIDIVKNIADNTNLLALNASIEAARAGEAGKGFSVVAEEVKKLAMESVSSAEQINKMIMEFRRSIIELITNLDEGIQQEREDAEKAKQTNELFEEITNSLNSITDTIVELNNRAAEQQAEAEEINKGMAEISSISEETAASTQEVSASVEEQTAIFSEISNESNYLDNLGQSLQQVIQEHSKIKVDKKALDTKVKRIETFFNDLYTMPEIKSLDPQSHTRIFKNMVKKHDDLLLLFSYRPDSTRIGCSNPEIPEVDLRNRPWFINALKGETFISDLYISIDTQKVCFTVAKPIFDERENTVGVLGVDVEFTS